MRVIECQDLTKVYGRVTAIQNLSFNIEKNKITGLIGRNGAGKTTLLKIMAGFLRKTKGEIKVFSANPFNNIQVSANMIFIDDQMIFPNSLRLADILEGADSFYENWDMGLAMGLLDYFGLHTKQFHRHLSKGMKSTFNIIIGLSARCALTIFDEPTIGMDVAIRKDFYRALLKDYLAFPRSMIISSHLLNEIEHVLEDVLLIRDGEKLLHLPVAELKELALGLRGKASIINQLTKKEEIIHQEIIGKDSLYVVIKNNFTKGELQNARTTGVELSSVATDDLCVYLTAGNKGGIDDVFDRN